jgi:hypothetical protein
MREALCYVEITRCVRSGVAGLENLQYHSEFWPILSHTTIGR